MFPNIDVFCIYLQSDSFNPIVNMHGIFCPICIKSIEITRRAFSFSLLKLQAVQFYAI